jgi:LPXTG-motif cell wall-anchored protein
VADPGGARVLVANDRYRAPVDPGLAVTGADIAGLTVIGVVLLGAGLIIVRRTRPTTD